MKWLMLAGFLLLMPDIAPAQQSEAERILNFIRDGQTDIARSQFNGSDNKAAVRRLLRIQQNSALSEGIGRYNAKQYNEALDRFRTSVAIAGVLGVTDSLALYNCGLAAEKMNDWDTAASYYKRCIDIGYKGAVTYAFLIYVHQQAGKEAEALAVLAEGRKKYPQDQNLLTTQLNQYLGSGDYPNAEKLLHQAISLDADRPDLYYTLGAVYDYMMQTGLNKARTSDETAAAMKRLEQAEAAYIKALQLNPDFFEVRYNLGTLYFNRGVEQSNAAGELTDPAQYKAEKEQANALFKKALVELEKAQALNPDDRNTLTALMQIYARLDMPEKYQEVSRKLKGN